MEFTAKKVHWSRTNNDSRLFENLKNNVFKELLLQVKLTKTRG